jgi:hypothetical protein
MRTRLRSKVTLLFLTIAVLLAVPAVAAIADVVQNNIDPSIDATAETRTVSTDGSTVVGYTLRAAQGPLLATYPDPTNGCNAQGGNNVTVTINTPEGVTASPSSLVFNSCDVPQNVTFTATKAAPPPLSPHVITVNASGGVSGSTTHTNPATWHLIVNKAQPTFSAVSGTGNAGASNGSLTATLKNANVTPNKNLSGKEVTFKIDGNDVPGTATTNDSGVATLNNVDLSGVSQGSHALNALFAGDDDYFGAGGSGTLTVGPPLCTPTSSVTTQPTDQTVTYGANSVSFTAAANGSPAPGVQWQVNTGSGFTNIPQATNGTLTINNPAVADSGKQYRAVFTNTCNGTNTVTSDAATLTVEKATATVTLNNLTHTYDGTAKAASATTTPAGLNVKFAYSQNSNPVTNPTNAGSYNVVATVDDPNYQGSKSGTLTIEKATQTIDFGPLANKTFGDPDFGLNATASSGLSVSYAASGNCSIVGANNDQVRIDGAGSCTVTASQAGNDNFNAATPVPQSFNITYNFTGFSSPVDNPPVLNTAKAGQAIPLKWRLTDAGGNPVTNLLSTDVKVTVANYSCGLSTTADLLEEYAAGSSGLQNLGNGYYQFNWKTPTNYANSCKTMTLDLGEGTLTTPHTALFKFTK